MENVERDTQRPVRMNIRKRKKVCIFCEDKVAFIDYRIPLSSESSFPSAARFFPEESPEPALFTSVS